MLNMGKTYSEKLRDPRWQRKRLQILNEANFICEDCGSDEKPLNVHHIIYRRGKSPWDYENKEFKCLCDTCHQIWHHGRQDFNEMLLKLEIEGIGTEVVEWVAIWLSEENRCALSAVFNHLKNDFKKAGFIK